MTSSRSFSYLTHNVYIYMYLSFFTRTRVEIHAKLWRYEIARNADAARKNSGIICASTSRDLEKSLGSLPENVTCY